MTTERPRTGRTRPSENLFDGLSDRMNRHVGDLVLVNLVAALTTMLLALPLDGWLFFWAGVTAMAALALGLVNAFSTRGMKKLDLGDPSQAGWHRGTRRGEHGLITFGILFGLVAWIFQSNAAAFALAAATALLIAVWIWVLRDAPRRPTGEGPDPLEDVWKK